MKAFLLLALVSVHALALDYVREFVVPERTFPANHASTLAELPKGELLSCWFAGSEEAAADVQIVCSRRPNAGAWSAPFIAVAKGEGGKFVGNPSLLVDDEGTIWLFYEAVRYGGHSGAFIDYKTSFDNGVTWSVPKRLVGSFGNFGHLPRNRALRISANRFLLPVYREFLNHYGYVFDLILRQGKIQSQARYRIPGEGHLQPALVRLSANTVGAYLRKKHTGHVLFSSLDLTTKVWSAPRATNLPNPDAAVDALRVGDKIYLAYNDSFTGRSPLSLAVSDDGLTFKKIWDFETGPGSFAYPCLLPTTDGALHLTYSYNRTTIAHLAWHLKR